MCGFCFHTYSVAFWVKVNSAAIVSNDYLFYLGEGPYRLRMYLSGSVWRAYEGNADSGSFAYESAATLATGFLDDDAWHHIVIASSGKSSGSFEV